MLTPSVVEKFKPYFLAGLALTVASVALRLCAFFQTDFANGWDSYFYLVQTKSITETGQMHSPEGSLIYPFLRVCYWFTHDYVAALKWGTALLCGAWTAGLYCLPRSRKRGLLLATWSVFSPHLTYFAAQFPKNLLGMVLFLALITAFERGGRNKWIYSLMLLIINFFGHRMSFGLSVVYLVLNLLFTTGAPIIKSMLTRKNLVFALVILSGVFIAGSWLPGLAHWMDFHRLDGTLSATPQFAPWSFVTTFGWTKISGYWCFELVVAVLMLVVQLIRWASHRLTEDRQGVALLALLLLLLFPFLKWTFLGLSYRFFLVFVLIAPLVLLKIPLRTSYWLSIPLLLMGALFSWKSYQPALHDPNYALFSRVTRNTVKKFDGSTKPELVIAHNALAEYFTFSTGIDAMPWLPEYPIDSTRLWRIATGVRFETLRYFAGEAHKEMLYSMGGGYFLLPEYVWQEACRRAKNEDDQAFLEATITWRNPHAIRPVWLLHRKK